MTTINLSIKIKADNALDNHRKEFENLPIFVNNEKVATIEKLYGVIKDAKNSTICCYTVLKNELQISGKFEDDKLVGLYCNFIDEEETSKEEVKDEN